VFRHLSQLVRYRGLMQSLVARELKARYRGSVLGFFWSFFNPLLLLLVYTFVFKYVLVGQHPREIEPYALFLFCGLLPWTWFSSSLVESANVLIAGGYLIKKVLFPAEVLPIVTVLANLVHFCFGLPLQAAALARRAGVVPGGGRRAAHADAGARVHPVGADGAFSRHQGHPRQPADVLVLRHADHLCDADLAAPGDRAAEPEPDRQVRR